MLALATNLEADKQSVEVLHKVACQLKNIHEAIEVKENW